MRQHDVEPDGTSARIRRAAIARLHYPRPAAGDDDVLGAFAGHGAFGDHAGEFARFLVIFRHVAQGVAAGRVAIFGARNARAAKQHDGRFDPVFIKAHLGLEKLQLQPHGAQFIAAQEIVIRKRQAIGGGLRLRRVGKGFRIGDILVGIAEWLAFVFHTRSRSCNGFHRV